MTVKRDELVALHNYILKRKQILTNSPDGNISEIFDLDILDSNISLLVITNESDEIELKTTDKQIKEELKKFRLETGIVNKTQLTVEEVAVQSEEIINQIEELKKSIEILEEKILKENILKRLEIVLPYLQELQSLNKAPKKVIKLWQTEKVPLPKSSAAKIMGNARTQKKTLAARENGKKGGRPKKETAEKTVAKKSSVKKAVSKKAEPKKTTTRKTASKKTISKKTT